MRFHLPFGDLWGMPIEVPYSLLVKDRELAWTCGQLPLDAESRVLAPGDLAGQTEIVCDHIEEILKRSSLDIGAIGQINLYYVAQTSGDAGDMLSVCRRRFGARPILVPISVPYFYYDGLLIEADVFTGWPAGDLFEKTVEPSPIRIVDGGELVWVAMEVADSDLEDGLLRLDEELAKLGLAGANRLSDHWSVAGDDAVGRPAADIAERLARMDLISDPGALVRGSQFQDSIIGQLTFVKGRSQTSVKTTAAGDGIQLASRQAGRFTWVTGRSTVSDDGLVDQTTQVMAAIDACLRTQGLAFTDALKSTCHYVGDSSAEDLHDNMSVRNRYYRKPGPASTGLPVFGLADGRSKTAIDILFAQSS